MDFDGVAPSAEPSQATVSENIKDGAEEERAACRRVTVPINRVAPLRNSWTDLIAPLVRECKLAVRYDTANRVIILLPAWAKAKQPANLSPAEKRAIEARMNQAVEYVKAFLLGFQLRDCEAILRLEDIMVQSFAVTDVKLLANDNLSRAVGRVTGREGKIKNAIQNATRTRVVVADKRIHLMGSAENVTLARDAICSLIIGRPPNKVYQHLNVISRRMKEQA